MDKIVLKYLNSLEKDELISIFEKVDKLYKDLKEFNTSIELFDKLYNFLVDEYGIYSLVVNSITKFYYKHGDFRNSEYTLIFDCELNDDTISFMLGFNDKFIYETVKQIEIEIRILFEHFEKLLTLSFLRDKYSYKDHLTGVYNRKFLEEYLNKVLPLALRKGNKVAFLALGVDRFKAVIDEFGYNIGDKLIIEIANMLKKEVRGSDIIARLDSDEFIIVLPDIKDEKSAMQAAIKLINYARDIKVVVNEATKHVLKKSISIGISIFPDHSLNIEELIKLAYIALYDAKDIGREQIIVYQNRENNFELF